MSVNSSRLCSISANAIGSQQVRNEAHKTETCETTRPINKQQPEIWKDPFETIPAREAWCRPPEVNLRSGLYFPGAYTPHRIRSQILVVPYFHVLYATTQNFQDMDKRTNSCDPQCRNTNGDPKILSNFYTLCVSPSGTSWRDSPKLVSNQLLTHYSSRKKRAFDTGGRSCIRQRKSLQCYTSLM